MQVDKFANKEVFLEIFSTRQDTQSIFLNKESVIRLIRELENIIK